MNGSAPGSIIPPVSNSRIVSICVIVLSSAFSLLGLVRAQQLSTHSGMIDFYQFWLNSDDAGVEDYLKVFTLLGKSEIKTVMAKFKKNPAERHAQKMLAYEVTKIVHGQRQADKAVEATAELFKGGVATDAPTVSVAPGKHEVVDLLVKSGLAESKSEARRLLEQGGVKLNQKRVDNQEITVAKGDLLQAGKRRFVKIV